MFVCSKCGCNVQTINFKCPICFSTETLIPVIREQDKLLEPKTDNSSKIMSTGFDNIDNLLNGGMVKGCIHFFVAPPGGGKTTGLFQISAHLIKMRYKVYYFTGEETPNFIFKRAVRLGIADYQPQIFYNYGIGELIKTVRSDPPDAIIIDSIQTLSNSQDCRNSYTTQVSMMLQLKKLTTRYKLATWIICQVTKEGIFSGPKAYEHDCDVFIEAKKGINDEIILTTPYKNRLGPTGKRAVFRMTENGLIEINEQETGFILRHSLPSVIGLAAFVAQTSYGLTVDEITVVNNRKKILLIDGASFTQSTFLSNVIKTNFDDFQPAYIVRANLSEKIAKTADLAIIMAVLSKFYDKPLLTGTAYIASVDAFGKLLPVPEISMMVQRAKEQGYKCVVGAVPIGSQKATWETASMVTDVWKSVSNL